MKLFALYRVFAPNVEIAGECARHARHACNWILIPSPLDPRPIRHRPSCNPHQYQDRAELESRPAPSPLRWGGILTHLAILPPARGRSSQELAPVHHEADNDERQKQLDGAAQGSDECEWCGGDHCLILLRVRPRTKKSAGGQRPVLCQPRLLAMKARQLWV